MRDNAAKLIFAARVVVKTNCEKMVMVIVKHYGIQVIRISILILFLLIPGLNIQSAPAFLLYASPAKNKEIQIQFPCNQINRQNFITLKPSDYYLNLLSLNSSNPEKPEPHFYEHNYFASGNAFSGKQKQPARMNGPPPIPHPENSIIQPFKSKAITSSPGSFRIQDNENLLCSIENIPVTKDMSPSDYNRKDFAVLSSHALPATGAQIASFSCPADISTYTDINSCSSYISGNLNPEFNPDSLKTLTWEMAGASAEVSPQQGINLIDDFEFNEGATHITYTATDLHGQTTICSFTITISDNQVPRLADLPDITVGTNAGECSAIVYWNAPAASDNCTPAYLIRKVASIEPGTTFPTGTTTVSYTAYDAMGNESAVQSFTVTVRMMSRPN